MEPGLEIDGAMGEGGGQVLRTALSLSMVTGRSFRITRIRAGRKRPGLARQHLTAVRAAAEVCGAGVRGAEIGSMAVSFEPGPVRAGSYRFSTEGAGSATLVLQTVLPALLQADGRSRVTVEGGTHNPFAPPFDFLERAFVPLLVRMGARIEPALHRPGFFPAGGGKVSVGIAPRAMAPLELLERGAVLRRAATALVSALPRHIGERELGVVGSLLGIDEEDRSLVEVPDPAGPGNAVIVDVESAGVTEVFTGFGERGVPAEEVATRCADAVREYEAADVPVGRHLADQLLLPLALAGGGRFRTVGPTLHTRTNSEVIRLFLGLAMRIEEEGEGAWRVEVG